MLRAFAICERKRMLFWELVSRLRRISEEFGPEAAWIELVLQSAIADEDAAWQREQEERVKRKQ